MSKREAEAGETGELAGKLLRQQAAAMRASMDGVAILDRRGQFLFVNEAHARVYGYASPEELIGRSYRDLYSEAQLARLENEVMPAFWRAGHWRGELVGRRRDGSTFPQEISLSRIDHDSGAAQEMVCVVRDITERKRAEDEHGRLLTLEKTARAEAEAASRAKDEFLAVVSHELRTPMTAILGWTWLLRSGDVAPHELGKALDVIDRNMKLQAQIIEDLLDVSSIVTGKLHLAVKPVELSAVLGAAVETVRAGAEQSGITLQTQVQSGLTVSGDAHRLQQVCWNLLSNAIKFNKAGGTVRALVGVAEGCAALTVEDDGVGIEPSVLPEIFDPFRQAEDSLTREHRGLGLGLAIVRHLVELHGGSVSAASAGKGKGASFTVLLPLLEVRDGAGAGAKPPAGRPPRAALKDALKGVTVLVVDDEPDTVAVMSELLRHCGAQVSTALSAGEALEELRKASPKLLLCDLAMPGEDGYSLIRKLRDMTGGGKIRALALSARARDDDRERALEAGFDRFLAKPAELEVIVAYLRELAGL
jgi:PAS domain S-box-containing protein